ncbi:putative enoyl-CoA hydratase isoform X4 [Amblyomma americanum]
MSRRGRLFNMQAMRTPLLSAVRRTLRPLRAEICASSDAGQSNRCQTHQPPHQWIQFDVGMKGAGCSPVVCDKRGRILLVGLNRPEKRNSLNAAATRCLLEALRELDRDDSVDVAVLHGKGGSFCAGYDLVELAEDRVSDWPVCIPETKKPTVAAVTGYAVGAGMELALWCDLRVVDETAVMGLFGRRFAGVPLMAGGSARLPALIGLSRALDLILTGRPVSAKEAHEIGLANRVVSCGTALGQAISLAGSIAKFPQRCVQADLRATRRACFGGSPEEEEQHACSMLHAEAVQGAKQFVSGIGHHGSFNLLHPPKESAAKP